MPQSAVIFGRLDAKNPGEQAAHGMADYVNNMGHSPKEFVEGMSHQHRTLQQSFTGVCIAWLKHLSELQEFQYDLRNEDSVKLAKKLLEERPGLDPKYDLGLSYI